MLLSLIIPAAKYNKIIFLLMIAMYLGFLLYHNKTLRLVTVAPLYILIIFAFGFVHGMLNEANMSLASQFFLSTSILLLIYPIQEFEINFENIIKKISPIYLFITILYNIYALGRLAAVLNPAVNALVSRLNIGIVQKLGEYIYVYGEGASGIRSFFGVDLAMVHIGSAPFLIVPLVLYFENYVKERKIKSLIASILCFVLEILSTSRALILISILMCVIVYTVYSKISIKLIVIVIFVIAGAYALEYMLTSTTIFSAAESGNSVKLGHLRGYFQNLNIKNALIGDGLASYYYSPTIGVMEAHTEITLLDYCRYFGVIPALSIYIALVIPYKSISNKFKNEHAKIVFITFLGYLIISLTNPVLFNSIGTVVILWYWNCVLMGKNEMTYEYEAELQESNYYSRL